MPEGPSVRRWGDIARQFLHKRIKEVKGVSKVMDRERWRGAFINNVIVYGKQLFFQLLKNSPSEPGVKVSDERETSSRRKTKHPCGDKEKNDDAREDSIWYRYHFLMWGSLRANEYKEPSKRSKRAKKMENPKAPNPMVEFHFDDESFLVFYGGSILVVDGPCEDEGTDVLSDTFDVEKAATALRQPVPICYTLMDQTHFAGAGNIVKNEVLYASRMHPLELGSNLTEAEAVQIAKGVVRFTTAWLKWEDELSKYQKFSDLMKMYWKFKCPDGHKTMRGFFGEHLKRMTTWCPECQALRVESEISKSELENIGKIKKTTRVKRENEGESDDNDDDDDDGNENIKRKQKKKVKLAKDKSDVVIKKTVRKSTNLKYEDDDDFGQKLPSSKARKSSVAKGQKKGKSPAIKRKTEKGSVESVSAEKVASKKKSRKRTHSDVNRADADDSASVENKKEKFMKKSMRTLRSRVKTENQGTEDDKSKGEILHKLPTTLKTGSEIEKTCSVRVRNKGKIRSSDQPGNVSSVTVGDRTIIKEESNPSSESAAPIENELIKKKSIPTEEKDVFKRRSSRLKKSVNCNMDLTFH